MAFYDFIFCVVVYRNYSDLTEFLESIKEKVIGSYRVIIVNNYFDDDSEKEIKKLAALNNCDFIHADNNGYGSGNNIAISHALKNYEFEYLIVSNPDIIVEKLNIADLSDKKEIIAPLIKNKNGKRQNPAIVKNIRIAFALICTGFKRNNKIILYSGLLINKLVRILFNTLYNVTTINFKKIYMAHGSFVIFHRNVIETLHPIYDPNMFLFSEENLVALKARKKQINTWYTNSVEVLHKEDGSMVFRNDINDQQRKSCLYFYEKYYKSERRKGV